MIPNLIIDKKRKCPVMMPHKSYSFMTIALAKILYLAPPNVTNGQNLHHQSLAKMEEKKKHVFLIKRKKRKEEGRYLGSMEKAREFR